MTDDHEHRWRLSTYTLSKNEKYVRVKFVCRDPDCDTVKTVTYVKAQTEIG